MGQRGACRISITGKDAVKGFAPFANGNWDAVNDLESIKSLKFNFADYSKVEEYIKSENFQL